MSEGILVHELVPKHVILEDSEIKKIFKDLDFHQDQLPKINVEDPVAKAIGAEVGNVLEITRESETAGTFVTYRLVEL